MLNYRSLSIAVVSTIAYGCGDSTNGDSDDPAVVVQGDRQVTNDSELEALAGVTEVSGSLTISGTGAQRASIA
jgi:hypothetical protein